MDRREFFKAAAAVAVLPVMPAAASPATGRFNPALWGAARDRDPLWVNMPYKMSERYSEYNDNMR